MLVTLVPLVLAANLSSNVGDWKYGPEVIYDAKIDNLIHPIEKFERIIQGNITVKLKCRPKTDLVLSCHIYEPRILVTQINATSKDKIPVVEEISELDDKLHSGPFELNFDNNGLKEIVVSSALNSIVDTWIDLAKLLNYGEVVTTMPISVFDIMEDPTTGRCKTHYTQTSERLVNNETKSTYDIVMIPAMRVPRGMMKGIKKSPHISECSYRYDYYEEGPRIVGRLLNGRTDMPEIYYETELKSSKSRMVITPNKFFSRAEEVVIIKRRGNLGNKYYSPVERKKVMSIDLLDIVPAKGPLEKIDDPTTISVFSVEQRETYDSFELN